MYMICYAAGPRGRVHRQKFVAVLGLTGGGVVAGKVVVTAVVAVF
jgi:hypothetical protein